MVVAHKKDGSVRVCIDPRPLNVALKREHYHIPTFQEILPGITDAKVFSKVDMKSGYWHVVLDDTASKLTTFQTPLKKYKWNRLPFGQMVSGDIFQRRVHDALVDLEGIYCIVDDIIVAGVSADIDEATKPHDKKLANLLNRCQEKNIALTATLRHSGSCTRS